MSKPNRHPMSLPSAITEAREARERLNKYAADCEVTMLCPYPRQYSMIDDLAMARLLEYIRELERKCEGPLVQGPNNEGSHG